YAASMTANTIKKGTNDLYYHAGAILSPNGEKMQVKYYQFPSWSQLETSPSNLQLEEIKNTSEDITYSFKSLRPSWVGNKPIKQDIVTTEHNPAIVSCIGKLFLLYSEGSSQPTLKLCTASIESFNPTSKNDEIKWGNPLQINVN